MADNTEIKKIIDIEFRGSKTIGDIKNTISQLKKELDQCANGSEEAAAKTLELARAQNTLSAAMKGCVDETGKLDNSYNGLVTRMNRLKITQKQIDISTKEGQKEFNKLGKEIKSINDRLVKLDATNGVFGRNVGNYTSALSAMGGQFGTIARGINTVRLALQALKASAGWIGLVVSILAGIVGAIKSNEEAVDKLKDAVSPLAGIFNQLVVVAQKLGDVFSKVFTWATNGVVGLTEWLLKAIGAEETLEKMHKSSEISFYEEMLKYQTKDFLQNAIAYDEEIVKLRNEYLKWRNDENKAAEIAAKIEDVRLKKASEEYALKLHTYELEKKKLDQTKSTVEEQKELLRLQADANQKQTELLTTGDEWNRFIRKSSGTVAVDAITDALEKAKQKLKEYENLNNEAAEKVEKIQEKLRNETNEYNDNLTDINKNIVIFDNSVDHAAQGITEWFVQTNELTDNWNTYIEDLTKAGSDVNKYAALIDAQLEYIQMLSADLVEAKKRKDEEAAEKAEKAAEEYQKLHNQLVDDIKKQSEVLNDYILSYLDGFKEGDRLENLTNKQLEEINNTLKDTHKWNEIINADAYRIGQTISKELLPESLLQRLTRLREEFKKGLQLSLDKGDITEKQFQEELERFGKDFAIKVPVIVEEPEEETDEKSMEVANKVRKRIEATVDAYKDETKNIHQEYEQQKKDLQIALNTKLISQEQFNTAMKNLDKKYLDSKKEIMYEEIKIYTEMADSIASILGSIADMWEDDLRTKVEHGQMTQEQAEKEFEDVKAFQIAEAVISTISGAIAGYAGAAGNSGINSIPYVGPFLAQAVGITNAAAVTASGIAQIAKIKNTQFGSSSVSSGGYGGKQSFQLPALETYKPNYSQNLTSASDTIDLAESVATAIGQQNIRAFVVEADITNAQQRSSKRQSEATW